jgi:hypothetical protein
MVPPLMVLSSKGTLPNANARLCWGEALPNILSVFPVRFEAVWRFARVLPLEVA